MNKEADNTLLPSPLDVWNIKNVRYNLLLPKQIINLKINKSFKSGKSHDYHHLYMNVFSQIYPAYQNNEDKTRAHKQRNKYVVRKHLTYIFCNRLMYTSMIEKQSITSFVLSMNIFALYCLLLIKKRSQLILTLLTRWCL